MTDTPTGPLVERVARALAAYEREEPWFDAEKNPTLVKKYLADAAELLRRAGIGEPVGLVWREDAGLGQSVAEVPFLGAYRVYPTATTQRYAYLLGHIGGQRIGDSEFHTFPDETSARAACEADYQARALTMWPALAGEVERLRVALRFLRDQFDECVNRLYGGEFPVETNEEEAGFDLVEALLMGTADSGDPRTETPSGSDNAVSADAIRAEIASQHERLRTARVKAATSGSLVSGQTPFYQHEAKLREGFIASLSALLPPAQEESHDG